MGPGLALCFSPDGSLVAGCDWNNIISVWKTDTLERIAVFAGNSKATRPWALAFHPDNRTLLSTGGGLVKVWDTSTRSDSELVTQSKKHNLWHLDYSSDGSTLVASGPEGGVKMFDARNAELLGELSPPNRDQGHPPMNSWAPQVAISSDGRTLVAGNGDHSATVYSVHSHKVRFLLEEHPHPLVNIRISPDNRLIGTVAEDYMLRLWDMSTGEKVKEISGVACFDFHPEPESRTIAVRKREQHTIVLLNYETEEILTTGKTSSSVWSVTFAPDGKRLAVGMENLVGLYQVPDLKEIALITGPRGPVPMVALHPDGDTIAIPGWGGTLHLWNAKVLGIAARMPVPMDWPVSAQFSPDGNTLAVSTKIAGIQLFRAPGLDHLEA